MTKELRSWKNYIFQSLLATMTTFIVLLLLSMEQAVIIASIGATAFIVFAMPTSITARPRNVIGGHLIGLLCGSICALIPQPSFLHSGIAYSLAVGLSFFMMVIADAEHPPASGTALGVAITGFSLDVMVAVITSAVVLSLAHHFLRPFLRDLT
ncbi:MAG: HPP family protein [Chloroflexota bacterium]|nr:MAG: HPP family protein [Chloroflexota bacterium]